MSFFFILMHYYFCFHLDGLHKRLHLFPNFEYDYDDHGKCIGAVTFTGSSTSTPVWKQICFALCNVMMMLWHTQWIPTIVLIARAFVLPNALANLDQYGNQFVHMDEPIEFMIAYVPRLMSQIQTVNDSISIVTHHSSSNDVSRKEWTATNKCTIIGC